MCFAIKRQAKEIAKLDFQPMNHVHHEPQSPNGDDYMKKKESIVSDAKIESKMQLIGMVKSIKKIEKKRSKDKKAIKTLGIIMGKIHLILNRIVLGLGMHFIFCFYRNLFILLAAILSHVSAGADNTGADSHLLGASHHLDWLCK